jgi:hypothetical protein
MLSVALPLLLLLLLPMLGTEAANSTTTLHQLGKKPFDIVWSGLWPCCAGQSSVNLTAFPVLQQHRLAIFDTRFGLYEQSFPPLGLPQTVDLGAHKAKVAHDVTHDGGDGNNVTGGIVPAGKDMYCKCRDLTPPPSKHMHHAHTPPTHRPPAAQYSHTQHTHLRACT